MDRKTAAFTFKDTQMKNPRHFYTGQEYRKMLCFLYNCFVNLKLF